MRRPWVTAVGAVALLLTAALAAQVPSGGPYSLPRQAIAGGGERASGGGYELIGTVGQSATGPAGAASFAVQQGFHSAATSDQMFRNGFE